MTPEQCRLARRLLGMTQAQLAGKARIPVATLSLYERTGRLSADRIVSVRKLLATSGANFADNVVLVEGAQLEHMSGQQCREARLLLGWTQKQLGDAAGMSHNQIWSFEARGTRVSPRRDFNRAGKIRVALEAVGVEFITDNDGMPGVRLRKPTE